MTKLKAVRGSTLGQQPADNDDSFRYLPNGASSVGGAHRNAAHTTYKTLPGEIPATTPQKLKPFAAEPSLTEDIIEKKL